MTKHLQRFEKVYIEKEAQKDFVAQRALKIFPKERVQVITESFFKKAPLSAKQIKESKKILFLKRFKGAFFKRCPGAKPKLLCCNYYVLNLGQNCEMDCSYCYLQSFINFPAVVIYTNIDQALKELEQIKKTSFNKYLRIGTGEQIDSLSLDDISLYSTKLIKFFNECPHWLLEFKTKSDNIKNFKDIEHKGNVVVSWSINPEALVQKEEHETASLKQRLLSALEVKKRGFKVSFHIDPLIYHENWKTNYAKLVDQISTLFKPTDLKHISLGALRFPAPQKALMRSRFGMESLVCRGEFFPSKDGKLRYSQELRQEMFDFILNRFKQKSLHWPCFLCMETPEVWLGSMGELPKKIPNIKQDFDLKSFKSL